MAPGRKVSPADLAAAIHFLESKGYKVVLGKNIFQEEHSYLAASDQHRLDDLQSMIDNSDVAAIMCARGGYGTTRFIDELDFSMFLRNPKWIVGFSDITALHLRLFREGVESIHGIMPALFSKSNAVLSVNSLMEILTGTNTPVQWNAIEYNRKGKATGQIMGGNLSLVVDSLGTNSEPDTKGKILVLEEIEEYRYKIDRMMVQLKRAGKLHDLAGLVLGHMTSIFDTEVSFGETVEQIIIDKVKEFQYPVAFGFPSGHDEPNTAWRHGSVVTLEVSEVSSALRNQ